MSNNSKIICGKVDEERFIKDHNELARKERLVEVRK
jgi:hypothetical protein